MSCWCSFSSSLALLHLLLDALFLPLFSPQLANSFLHNRNERPYGVQRFKMKASQHWRGGMWTQMFHKPELAPRRKRDLLEEVRIRHLQTSRVSASSSSVGDCPGVVHRAEITVVWSISWWAPVWYQWPETLPKICKYGLIKVLSSIKVPAQQMGGFSHIFVMDIPETFHSKIAFWEFRLESASAHGWEPDLFVLPVILSEPSSSWSFCHSQGQILLKLPVMRNVFLSKLEQWIVQARLCFLSPKKPPCKHPCIVLHRSSLCCCTRSP